MSSNINPNWVRFSRCSPPENNRVGERSPPSKNHTAVSRVRQNRYNPIGARPHMHRGLKSRRITCCRLVVATRSLSAKHGWVEYHSWLYYCWQGSWPPIFRDQTTVASPDVFDNDYIMLNGFSHCNHVWSASVFRLERSDPKKGRSKLLLLHSAWLSIQLVWKTQQILIRLNDSPNSWVELTIMSAWLENLHYLVELWSLCGLHWRIRYVRLLQI